MYKRKVTIWLIASAFLVFAFATRAGAHVTVSPDSAPQGGEAQLTFNMPAEKDNANAVKLEIDIPTDHPIANVSIEPKTGWSYTVDRAPLAQPIQTDDGTVTQAVSKIIWTATNGGLKPGEFEQFTISAGPLPDTNQIEFKALQTYSDGGVVRWIDQTQSSGPEPDHPAPVLKLTPAGASDSTATDHPAYATKSTANAALITGLIGLVVGISALIIGIVALRRRNA